MNHQIPFNKCPGSTCIGLHQI